MLFSSNIITSSSDISLPLNTASTLKLALSVATTANPLQAAQISHTSKSCLNTKTSTICSHYCQLITSSSDISIASKYCLNTKTSTICSHCCQPITNSSDISIASKYCLNTKTSTICSHYCQPITSSSDISLPLNAASTLKLVLSVATTSK